MTGTTLELVDVGLLGLPTPLDREHQRTIFGADNDHAFGELLGLSGEKQRSLQRDGVFD